MPNTLLPAMQFYIAHKAFEMYKSENDIFYSKEYYAKYQSAMGDFVKMSDSVDVDSVISNDVKIYLRGIR